MTRPITILPSPAPPDVDLAAEAALPFLLDLIREQRARRPPLRVVENKPSQNEEAQC